MTKEDPSLPNLTRTEVCKRYYERNKEKIKQKAKEAKDKGLYKERLDRYKEKHKEESKEYNKKYYEENKERISEESKKYYYDNHEKYLIKNRLNYHKNKVLKTEEEKQSTKEKLRLITANRREENKPNVIKSNRIKKWKSRGVICDDWNKLYDKYININNCEECNIELISGIFGSNKKCLDHNHTTGEFRNILCNLCNCRRR
jgi:hypothetical protein